MTTPNLSVTATVSDNEWGKQQVFVLVGYLMATLQQADGAPPPLGLAITGLHNDSGVLTAECASEAVGAFFKVAIETAWERISGSKQVRLIGRALAG
ncbi:hypothetical protein [Caballeronia sp. Lep1P3]|uniref:hypothetical protein n=1 Tax=Caballeronia sp. Lep1P3 TaxID=2878150 RepID=UPI001FD1BBE9|nr:hypothetical protein [Caballeronia sp. Lep1P3]